MRHKLSPVAALIAVLSASPVFADISAEDVWNDVVTFGNGIGKKVTADLSRDGDMLIAENVTLTSQSDMDGTIIEAEVARMEFTSRKDGTVLMSLPSPLVITAVAGPIDSEFAGADMRTTIELSGDTIASGDPDAITYALDAGAMHIESGSLDSAARLTPMLTMDIEGIAAQWFSEQTDAQHSGRFEVTADTLSYRGEPLETDGTQNGPTFHYAGQSYHSEGRYIREVSDDGTETPQPLSGLEATASQSIQSGDFTIASQGTTPITFEGRTGLATQSATVSGGRLDYTKQMADIEFDVATDAFPITGAGGSLALFEATMGMPIPENESAAPIDLRFALSDLEVTDAIWSMFDPSGQLPRDPANLVLDLSVDADMKGAMASPADPMDPNEFPQINEVWLNELLLEIAGASLSATGNAITQSTIGGIPEPVGQLDVTLTNVTGLIDQLASLGLMPMEQAGMAQMMIGMLARPGPNPNEMVAHIERTPDGQILSNGLPLPF